MTSKESDLGADLVLPETTSAPRYDIPENWAGQHIQAAKQALEITFQVVWR